MRDIPGFYYDAEKNRYFPLSSRTGQEQRKNVQDIPFESKGELKASPNVHLKVLQILHRREIGASPRFGTSCVSNSFKREYLETQVVKPWIWSYGECSGSAEGAVEEFYANIQTCEGLKGANVLAWSGNNGFLAICEIMPNMGGTTSLRPQPIFPLSCQSGSLKKSMLPHLLPSKWATIARSKVTSMRRLKSTANINNGSMICTTLGSAWEGGGIYLLKQVQFHEMSWSNGQFLPLDVQRCAVIDCSVWSAAYCSPTRATLGTSSGAVLVHLETSAKTWLIHSKSDVLSQECDSNGNLIFCGFRNGYISMVDIRSPITRPKMMPSMDVRLEKSLSSGKGRKKDFRKGVVINGKGQSSKEAAIAQNFQESMRMNSAICSLVLLKSDENYLLSSSMNGDINLWDRRLCEKGSVLTYEGNYNTHSMLSLGVDASESLLMSGGENCTLLIWSLQSGRLLQTISGLPGIINGFSSSELGIRGKSYLEEPSSNPWQMWLGSPAGPMYMHGASSGNA